MRQNTRKPRNHQARRTRRTLAEVKRAYLLELITKAGVLALDRLMLQARGTLTRAECSKAVDALIVAGSVVVELRPWGVSIEPIPATDNKPAGNRTTSSKKVGGQ